MIPEPKVMSIKEIGARVNYMLQTGVNPRFHGNGFIQLYLDEAKTTRLHVWHPAFKPQRDHNALTHDHRFDMSSTILLGALKHTTFTDDTGVGDYSHGIYSVVGASKFREAEFNHLYDTYLSERHRYTFWPGTSYNFLAGNFHTSEPANTDEITATIMTRSNMHATKWARVAVTKDTDPDSITHAFDPELQPSRKDLIEALHATLSIMHDKAVHHQGHYLKHLFRTTD